MTIDLPALPHWETIPDDRDAAVREIKRAITARMAANGTTPAEALAKLEKLIAAEVAEIKDELARGESPWPVIQYDDVANGTVPAELLAKVTKRGCAVIKGTHPREVAEQWDRDIVEYTEKNQFFENYRGPGDDFFMTVEASKPEIYPLYWSSAQMEARQSPRMATAQAFMNSFWKSESDGRRWFDAERDTLYPDRMRRRPPGTNSSGLSPHLDPGNLDLWMTEGYQKHFRHLFDGDVERYDPWDAAYRTDAAQYDGTTMTSVFRTFQSWTALSDMKHDQGVLHVVPIPLAMGYLMLRPLADDVAETDLEVWAYTDEQWLLGEITPRALTEVEMTGSTPHVAELGRRRDVIKMLVFPTKPEHDALIAELKAIPGFDVVCSYPGYMDIVHSDSAATKGGDFLQADLGITWADSLAVGDGENDLGMLSKAAVACCMTPLKQTALAPAQPGQRRADCASLFEAIEFLESLSE